MTKDIWGQVLKVLFFDIDGTLLDSNGVIAESSKEAIKQAKANGHKMFLCTGRTRSQVWPELLQMGFDGIVSVAGAEAIVGDEIIYQSIMEPKKVEKFLDLMEPLHISYGLQTSEGTLTTQEGWDKTMDRFVKLGAPKEVAERNMSFFEPVPTLRGRNDVYKMFYNFAPMDVDEVQRRLGDYFLVEQSSFSGPDPFSGEITKRGIGKANGMDAVMKHFNLTREDAIAFGDGPNDMDMIEYASIGVVMGNGRDSLKAIADYITDDIFHDGIYNAMKHFELI